MNYTFCHSDFGGICNLGFDYADPSTISYGRQAFKLFKAVVLAREAQRRSNLSYRLASNSVNAEKIASLCEKQKLAMTSKVSLT